MFPIQLVKDQVETVRKALAHKLHRSLTSTFAQLLTGLMCLGCLGLWFVGANPLLEGFFSDSGSQPTWLQLYKEHPKVHRVFDNGFLAQLGPACCLLYFNLQVQYHTATQFIVGQAEESQLQLSTWGKILQEGQLFPVRLVFVLRYSAKGSCGQYQTLTLNTVRLPLSQKGHSFQRTTLNHVQLCFVLFSFFCGVAGVGAGSGCHSVDQVSHLTSWWLFLFSGAFVAHGHRCLQAVRSEGTIPIVRLFQVQPCNPQKVRRQCSLD